MSNICPIWLLDPINGKFMFKLVHTVYIFPVSLTMDWEHPLLHVILSIRLLCLVCNHFGGSRYFDGYPIKFVDAFNQIQQ